MLASSITSKSLQSSSSATSKQLFSSTSLLLCSSKTSNNNNKDDLTTTLTTSPILETSAEKIETDDSSTNNNSKRPLTSYALFNKLANFEDTRVQEASTFEKRSKLVSSFWKQVPEKSKELFRQQVNEINSEKLELDTFLAIENAVAGNDGKKKQQHHQQEQEENNNKNVDDEMTKSKIEPTSEVEVDVLSKPIESSSPSQQQQQEQKEGKREDQQQQRHLSAKERKRLQKEKARTTREAVIRRCISGDTAIKISDTCDENDRFLETRKDRRIRIRRERQKVEAAERRRAKLEQGISAEVIEEEEKKIQKQILEKERKKQRKLSERQRYFKQHYSDVLNLPFHQRLAELHRMYEKQAQHERCQKASKKNLPVHDRTARLYAMFHGYNGNSFKRYAELEQLHDPKVIEKRVESLRRLYRQAVSSSVKKRGPRM